MEGYCTELEYRIIQYVRGKGCRTVLIDILEYTDILLVIYSLLKNVTLKSKISDFFINVDLCGI